MLADSSQLVRVILADDHAVVRAGISYALHERFPVTIVAEADDGVSLLAVLAAFPADLSIVDVTMPSFAPIAGLGHIHARFPSLKILVVTTRNANVDLSSLLRAGTIDGCYLKEQPLADLQLVVQRLRDGMHDGPKQAAQLIAVHGDIRRRVVADQPPARDVEISPRRLG